jgi:O-acetyl-ADP-ribose deacetylase (regulator of RNase III)
MSCRPPRWPDNKGMEFQTSSERTIELREDDITRVAADAIVNAANSALAGGGGVDGAIHRAGGPEIMRELDIIRKQIGRLPTGDAVVTSAGKLPARYVFHTVGPVYRDGDHDEPALLASCYRNCMRLADERGVATIAFPAISSGVYGYPLAAAARIAVREVVAYLDRAPTAVQRVIFVVFDHSASNVYAAALKTATGPTRRA